MQWSAAALLFSIAFTGGYTAARVLSNYRDHSDHLEVFCHAVNEQVVAHGWRYAVISGHSGGYDGMLLYLQKPHFLKPSEAVQEWNAGALDALLVPKDQVSEWMGELQKAVIAPFQSVDRKSNPQVGYFVITRQD